MVTSGRIQLHLTKHRCRGRWRRTTLPPHQVRAIMLQYGELADGRWYVDVVRLGGDECRPYPDERAARQVLVAWMRQLGGQWEQIPCSATHGWVSGEQERSAGLPVS